MKTTWSRSAMRFASAKYVRRQGMLDVTFENGDHLLVAVESILSKSSSGTLVDGADLRIGETGDVLEVPNLDTVVEIPWDRIRSIADPDFRAHLADASDERAHQIGKHIRTMRLEANLTPSELAARVGVPPETVCSLEAGKIEPTIDLIEHLALALGRQMRDFAAG